jgi:cytosine deaminase
VFDLDSTRLVALAASSGLVASVAESASGSARLLAGCRGPRTRSTTTRRARPRHPPPALREAARAVDDADPVGASVHAAVRRAEELLRIDGIDGIDLCSAAGPGEELALAAALALAGAALGGGRDGATRRLRRRAPRRTVRAGGELVTLLLAGGVDAFGEPLRLRADPATGRITDAGPSLPARRGDEVLDCAGMVLLPAPAEPHAHLDKALSAGAAPNPTFDLAGAIDAWHAYRPSLDEEEILGRARAAARELIAHGTTAIRSHVDVGPGIGLRAVHALLTLRDELAGLADLQIVALPTPPMLGPEGAETRGLVAEALHAGVDAMGGVPHLELDPRAATRLALEIAQSAGRPVDLHVDEQLEPHALSLEDLVELVGELGFEHGVVASHCVSLGVQEHDVQVRIAQAAAAAGVAIVALPQTNLYLQARDRRSSPPRGLTALRAVLDAGATLAAGADNVRDPFNCVGRSDALETAALLIMAGHLTPAEAYDAVSAGARRAMGLEPVSLEPGSPAEVLAVRGLSLVDAIARSSDHRIVIHAGRCVARTSVVSEVLSTAVPLGAT